MRIIRKVACTRYMLRESILKLGKSSLISDWYHALACMKTPYRGSSHSLIHSFSLGQKLNEDFLKSQILESNLEFVFHAVSARLKIK